MHISWTHWARGLDCLTPAAKLVCLELSLLADARGVALLPLKHLVDMTALPPSTVRGALQLLESQRRLRIDEPPDDDRHLSSWRLQLLRAPAAAPPHSESLAQPTAQPVGQPVAPPRSPWVSAPNQTEVLDGPGLAQLISQAIEAQWEGKPVWLLAAALEREGPRRFGRIIRQRRPAAGIDPWETLTLAWEILYSHAQQIAAAREPWGLWVHLTMRAGEAADRNTLTEVPLGDIAVLDWAAQRGGHSAIVVGALCDSPITFGLDDFDDRLRSVVGALVEAGMAEATAWAGTVRLLELAKSGDSRRHWLAARDSRLQALGIGGEAARAWMTMLVGSRRGSPGALSPGTSRSWRDRATKVVDKISAST